MYSSNVKGISLLLKCIHVRFCSNSTHYNIAQSHLSKREVGGTDYKQYSFHEKGDPLLSHEAVYHA